MSNVADGVDFRPGMVQWLGTLSTFYVKDIKALPESLLGVSPGGVAKAPNTMTAEVCGLMRWTAASLRGEIPESHYGAPSELAPTHEACCQAIESATAEFGDAISNADPAIFQKVITAPFGVDMPLMALTQVAINHTWYHDGQICQIQAMNGDDKVHWL